MINNLSSNIMSIKDISMDYCEASTHIEVLKEINFEVKKGEFICILGSNGCGKSTLLNIIAGFIKPTSGQIIVNGNVVSDAGPDRPIIPQDLGLFNWMNVFENVSFGLKAQGYKKKEIMSKANYWIENLKLDKFKEHYPFELSGGMRQKVAIARALALDSPVLLMDEPFASLDINICNMLQKIISELAHRTEKSVIMVTHSVDEALYLANKIIILSERPTIIKDVIDLSDMVGKKEEFINSTKYQELKEYIINKLNLNMDYLEVL